MKIARLGPKTFKNFFSNNTNKPLLLDILEAIPSKITGLLLLYLLRVGRQSKGIFFERFLKYCTKGEIKAPFTGLSLYLAKRISQV